MNRIIFSTLLLLIATPGIADIEPALKAAMAGSTRTTADIARDANRRPIETLKFFGLKENQRVLELVPGGGWYTTLLAPVLKERGMLYVALRTDYLEQTLLKEKGFEAVQVVKSTVDMERRGRHIQLKQLRFEVQDIDLALTFRNLHNFTEEGRNVLNAEIYRVLKPGGYYGVVDHSRRHMEEDHLEIWRRADPVQMIKEIQDAGFRFIDYSTLHYRPDDELRYEVGRKTVTGNTDRFTFLFQKPI